MQGWVSRESCPVLRFTLTPLAGVLEYLKPWRGLKIAFPVRWHIAPLPFEKGAFGMRHHGEVASIGRAKAGNTVRRTIWVKGISFGRGIVVIDVAHGGEVFAYDAVEYV